MTPPVPRPHEGLNGAVAAVLRGERAASEMTIEQLAEKADLTAISVRRYLKGQRNIDVAVLDALARALGTTMRDVVVAAEDRIERERVDGRIVEVNTRRRSRVEDSPVVPGVED